MLTSKGASGVTARASITLAATLSVVNPALVPGMAIVFSVDKVSMSEVRCADQHHRQRPSPRCFRVMVGRASSINTKLHTRLNQEIDPSDLETAVTTG